MYKRQVTYCPEEKILFSNDAFGQHYSSSKRYDDEVDLAEVMAEAEKYYANILMPYGDVYKRQAIGGNPVSQKNHIFSNIFTQKWNTFITVYQ